MYIVRPSITELKEYVARCKAAGKDTKYCYQIYSGVYVNPQYLLDMLQIFPNAEIMIDAVDPGKRPIYFYEAGKGDAILLLVNPATARTI